MEEEFIVVSETPTAQKRVYKSEFKGREYINVREYYKNDSGEFAPTKKGITFTPDQKDELIAALQSLT